MLVSNIMSCSVTQQKSPTILQLWPNERKLCRWLKIQWKGNGVMFVASRWYAPWFPQGLPNKQETVGFVCRLSAPVVVGHPVPGHMCVPLICGWGVGATHHPEKGVCAHTRAWACAGKIRGGHMCRQCRASGVRPRQPGLFQVQFEVQVQGHVHTEESRWALLNARSCPYYLTPLFWWCVETFFLLLIGGLAWCDEYWCWGNSESWSFNCKCNWCLNVLVSQNFESM